MLGETNGGGSGLGGTLLSVKGYASLPVSGKYGHIAVITTTSIGYWDIGYTEPTTRADGTALQDGDIYIGISSENALNIVKKNAIHIGFSVCKQYAQGAWANVRAYYYDTAWTKFSDTLLYLMKNGVFNDEYTFKAATGSWDTSDPYAVASPYTLSWVWAYNSDGYRLKEYSDSTRWLKMTTLYHVGSFSKIGIRYSATSYSGTVCRFGYNTATSEGSSVSDFTESPKYVNLSGSGLDTILTSYISIDSGHTDVTPFLHLYNTDMRLYDIWLE